MKLYGLIWNSFLCGNQKHFTKLKVYKLDKKKYPVFKIKKCICPKKCTCEKGKNCECKIEVKLKELNQMLEIIYLEF